MYSTSILAKDLEIGDIVKNNSILDISKNTYKGSNPRYHQSRIKDTFQGLLIIK